MVEVVVEHMVYDEVKEKWFAADDPQHACAPYDVLLINSSYDEARWP